MRCKAKNHVVHQALVFVFVLMLMLLVGCGRRNTTTMPAEPAVNNESVSMIEPAESSEADILIGRQNGERFEDVIILEGMEETVRHEHVRNGMIGFEMDYDYESFVRRSDANRECFISIYDNSDKPENYLEITAYTENADAVAVFFTDTLSQTYELLKGARTLDRAGDCIWIEASELKGSNRMADQLQVVYIIPASDGCRVAVEHFSVESAEGFGRRFNYMLNTLAVVDRTGNLTDTAHSITGTWQTASMAYEADGTMYPEYYVRFTDSEILYGHMKNGDFIPDHSDKIIHLEMTASDGFKVQAEAANGVQYTYQTSASDRDILEYYETWNEGSFPEMYRGGASLSRSY